MALVAPQSLPGRPGDPQREAGGFLDGGQGARVDAENQGGSEIRRGIRGKLGIPGYVLGGAGRMRSATMGGMGIPVIARVPVGVRMIVGIPVIVGARVGMMVMDLTVATDVVMAKADPLPIPSKQRRERQQQRRPAGGA